MNTQSIQHWRINLIDVELYQELIEFSDLVVDVEQLSEYSNLETLHTFRTINPMNQKVSPEVVFPYKVRSFADSKDESIFEDENGIR